MACASCGSELSADFAFCPRCGRRQPTACAACGAACEPDYAFCPRCGASRAVAAGPAIVAEPATLASGAGTAGWHGAPAATARHEADRRSVTVLFADVTGFTTLAARLDPEEVRAFQTALFDTLAQAITRY